MAVAEHPLCASALSAAVKTFDSGETNGSVTAGARAEMPSLVLTVSSR